MWSNVPQLLQKNLRFWSIPALTQSIPMMADLAQRQHRLRDDGEGVSRVMIHQTLQAELHLLEATNENDMRHSICRISNPFSFTTHQFADRIPANRIRQECSTFPVKMIV
jgi:hypothetical protein